MSAVSDGETTGYPLLQRQEGISLTGLARLASRLARVLQGGDLVLLEGPLGSGKTAFVRLLAQALGVTDPVRSPSFTLANVYGGAITVNHLDLYRLETLDDRDALALEEYRHPGSITLVEWPAAGLRALGRPTFLLEFEHETVDTRNVRLYAGDWQAQARWVEAA
jgi:tRNA threonylcarbamoyladenosine biosynthesis protein TsaE